MSYILLIDDDDAMRGMVRRALERDGHRVVEAIDGAEGMRQFRREHAELVITDIVMPNQEGIETILTLRQEAPACRIIAMSGGGRGIDKQDVLLSAEMLGVECTLAKPFPLADLRSAVRRLLPLAAPGSGA